jgi:hypothetical protein
MITLANGVQLPRIGLGTYKASTDVKTAVQAAYAAGVTHYDTAQIYKVRRFQCAARAVPLTTHRPATTPRQPPTTPPRSGWLADPTQTE